MKHRLIKIITELITINEENPTEELLNIIDELERVVLDMNQRRRIKDICVFFRRLFFGVSFLYAFFS